MDKFTEAYTNILKEDRQLTQKEFPEELKTAIKELMEINDKVKKRKEEQEKLDKQIRDLGANIQKISEQLSKNGTSVPSKYVNLVWDVLEALH